MKYIMKKRDEKDFQRSFDGKQKTPLHHAIFRGLARLWPLALIPFFLLALQTGDIVSGLLAAFAVNSLLTILFYREDKFLAQNNYWRIPEKYLHIWEFLCGWPGALYGQHVFNHKRSKTSFMIVFWLCVIANITALFLFFYYADPAKTGKVLLEWRRELSALCN